ncbi:MAG TPA: 50S ribosomal protein L9 [Candidatus Eisenbacteria bacterium]|jgi:large subunit ribosomal protein L9|nr:50S ribosomal protein L9 [Candidatus Eisenbacteria bacterium]
MEVILLEDISGLGKRGASVKVADGYARNFLLPRKKAIAAVGNSNAVFRDRERARTSREQKQRQAAEAIKDRLAQVSLQFSVQVGEEDQLYGSVTVADIHQGLEAQGFAIERRSIRLAEPLKALGMFEVPVHLFQDVEAPVKVWVVRQ